jgi:hypothetical protein
VSSTTRSLTLEVKGHRVRLVGGTLWTDYRLYGEAKTEASMTMSLIHLNDHRYIETGGRSWMPEHAAAAFERTKALIGAEPAKDHDGLTVVVTHHSPTPRAIAPKFKSDPLNPCFIAISRISFGAPISGCSATPTMGSISRSGSAG